jgi:signal transduction histidine kinase
MYKNIRKITRTGVLMIASQLLLVAFIAQWLYSEYKQERTDLEKDLRVQFAETQRQVLDSILLAQFITPMMQGDSLQKAGGANGLKGAFLKHFKPDTTQLQIHVKIDSSDNGHEKRVISTYNETVSFRKKADGHDVEVNGQVPARKDVFLKMQSDTPNAMLLQGVRLILDQVGKSGGQLRTNFPALDTALFQRAFTRKLKQNGWDFEATWVSGYSDTVVTKRLKPLYFQSNLFPDPYGVKIEKYGLFLFGAILPQMLFSLVLLLLTALAFWQSYATLKKQMRLGVLKDDLISNMSHELKTPVSTVKVALEALRDSRVMENRAMAGEYLEMATMEINRLDLLMTKVLNTSLLENKQGLFHMEPVDLDKVLDEVLQTMRLRMEKQGIAITCDKNNGPFLINADRLHVQGVIMNLLDNILKYAGNSREVIITLKKDSRHVQLAFADSGPGIPEEYLGKVFEKFFRVPTGDLHNTKGYGLGLSYAAQVMKQHGGSVSAGNLPLGGCVFTLLFPVLS